MKEQSAEFPEESDTEYVMVVDPIGKALPDVRLFSGSDGVNSSPELSVAVGAVHVAIAVFTPVPGTKSILKGQLAKTGFS